MRNFTLRNFMRNIFLLKYPFFSHIQRILFSSMKFRSTITISRLKNFDILKNVKIKISLLILKKGLLLLLLVVLWIPNFVLIAKYNLFKTTPYMFWRNMLSIFSQLLNRIKDYTFSYRLRYYKSIMRNFILLSPFHKETSKISYISLWIHINSIYFNEIQICIIYWKNQLSLNILNWKFYSYF